MNYYIDIHISSHDGFLLVISDIVVRNEYLFTFTTRIAFPYPHRQSHEQFEIGLPLRLIPPAREER